jgi:signal transduction histidine kinase
MPATLRVLVVEDHLPDAELVIDSLERAGYRCEWTRCETRDTFVAALDTWGYDLVLADYGLPEFSGLEALRLFKARDSQAPFIFVSGTIDEETALECVRKGATDYTFKNRLGRLGSIVTRALGRAEEARERRRAELALSRRVREQEAMLHLGGSALSSAGTDELLQEAAGLVAGALDVDHAEVLARLPDTGGCVVRASAGPAAAGVGVVEPPYGTPAALALGRTDPVILDQTQPLDGFPGAQRLTAQGMVTGVLVVIRGPELPFGVLACYSSRARDFSSENVLFLLTAASVLASGIERRRSEGALAASREEFRALSLRLQSLREEERSRIAREVHDELGQTLTATRIEVTRLLAAAERDGTALEIREAVRRGTDALLELTDETIASVRRIASELRPAILDHLGLEAAIEWQLRDFERRTGIAMELVGHLPDDIDPDRATACFRIVQEGLTNVARHSRARHVRVTLALEQGRIQLTLADDGEGIPPDSLRGPSLGLLGMRERATALGGVLEVAGGRAGGTVLSLRLPS